MNLKPNAIREKAETEKMIPPWVAHAQAGADFAPSSAAAGGRSFPFKANKLFHLHAAKSRTACALQRVQAHGRLVEPVVSQICHQKCAG
jgi:hypothetical protein